MDKKIKTKPSIINRNVIVLWMFSSAWGFIAYLYFGFQPIGNWIWKSVIHNRHNNTLNMPISIINSVSLSQVILWIFIFCSIYALAFIILIMLPSYFCLRYKSKTKKED